MSTQSGMLGNNTYKVALCESAVTWLKFNGAKKLGIMWHVPTVLKTVEDRREKNENEIKITQKKKILKR